MIDEEWSEEFETDRVWDKEGNRMGGEEDSQADDEGWWSVVTCQSNSEWLSAALVLTTGHYCWWVPWCLVSKYDGKDSFLHFSRVQAWPWGRKEKARWDWEDRIGLRSRSKIVGQKKSNLWSLESGKQRVLRNEDAPSSLHQVVCTWVKSGKRMKDLIPILNPSFTFLVEEI